MKTLLRRQPELKILVLSTREQRDEILNLFKTGALGYVLKEDTAETLVRAVREVAEGKQWLSRRIATLLVERVKERSQSKVEKLTGRELQVLQLLAQGFHDDQIARALSISENTVRSHVHHILRMV